MMNHQESPPCHEKPIFDEEAVDRLDISKDDEDESRSSESISVVLLPNNDEEIHNARCVITSSTDSDSETPELPFSFLTEKDKVRLALLSSSAKKPGAYFERFSEELKPMGQEELWKDATCNRQDDPYDDHDTTNQVIQHDWEPVSYPAELIGLQKSQQTMAKLQNMYENEESETGKKSYKFLPCIILTTFLVLSAIGLTLGNILTKNAKFTPKEGENGNTTMDIVDDSLFDIDMCYKESIRIQNKNRYDMTRALLETTYRDISHALDTKFSKESLSLCWLAYFDEFPRDLKVDELEILQRFILATIYFHFTRSIAYADDDDDDDDVDDELLKLKWLGRTSVCEWEFVNCSITMNNEQIITGIELTELKLEGKLPSELALLSNLTNIRVLPNFLTGSIPHEIWNLTQLEELSVFQNRFHGTFPRAIQNLNRLTLLILKTDFSGTIPDLNPLSRLRYLQIQSSVIEGNFPSIRQLTSLGKVMINIRKELDQTHLFL
jgi:hypothetical protein